MLNQIQLDLGLPFVVDPQNLPIWANQMTVSVESQWGLLASRVNNLLPNDGSEGVSWTAYTPVVTAGSGTFTTVSATGRYFKISRIVFVQMRIAITTNGTAATNVQATLPFTSNNGFAYLMPGQATAISGKMLQGRVPSASTNVTITNYDGTYPGASGEALLMTGIYEAAS